MDKTLSVPRINPQCAVATIGEETVIAVVGGFNDEGKNGARQILNSTEFYTVSNDGFMASKYILFWISFVSWVSKNLEYQILDFIS